MKLILFASLSIGYLETCFLHHAIVYVLMSSHFGIIYILTLERIGQQEIYYSQLHLCTLRKHSLLDGLVKTLETPNTHASYPPILRPRLARLHFTSEAILGGFSSMNSSIGGAEAVLINRLAKSFTYRVSQNMLSQNAMQDEVKPGENTIFCSTPP